ncbi:hypothetical protein [Streptomyces sp. MP131-18]|uniref:hypothetical protein n=1 Tax=Streptomyces sp. MP131-18 TaxID=1857892 RepID=UPI00097C390E|nr:hypothetical protein [Streptomyces sp. MP131-18]ONK13108.1 hypothetical protein STBA_38700 [Streptomyces sp. MP131-18]
MSVHNSASGNITGLIQGGDFGSITFGSGGPAVDGEQMLSISAQTRDTIVGLLDRLASLDPETAAEARQTAEQLRGL